MKLPINISGIELVEISDNEYSIHNVIKFPKDFAGVGDGEERKLLACILKSLSLALNDLAEEVHAGSSEAVEFLGTSRDTAH